MRPSPRPLESFANARTTSPGSQTRRLARAPRMIAHTQRRHAIHIPIAGKDKVYDIEDN